MAAAQPVATAMPQADACRGETARGMRALPSTTSACMAAEPNDQATPFHCAPESAPAPCGATTSTVPASAPARASSRRGPTRS
nr:hypothetical protein [Paenacidovorax monticola]